MRSLRTGFALIMLERTGSAGDPSPSLVGVNEGIVKGITVFVDGEVGVGVIQEGEL
jgi:hypothetical protein